MTNDPGTNGSFEVDCVEKDRFHSPARNKVEVRMVKGPEIGGIFVLYTQERLLAGAVDGIDDSRVVNQHVPADHRRRRLLRWITTVLAVLEAA